MEGCGTSLVLSRKGMPRVRFPSGFTLIELLIAIVIVAILAAVAIPGYQEQVRKTRRSTATAELLSVAQALERFSTVNGTYVGTPGDPSATPPTPNVNGICNRTLDFYTVSCQTLTATTFEVRAVPNARQSEDKCGTLTYTQAGVKGIVDHKTGIVPRDCW